MIIQDIDPNDEGLWWGALHLCRDMYDTSGYKEIPYSERQVSRNVARCAEHGFAKICVSNYSFIGFMLGELVPYTFSEETIAQDVAYYVPADYRHRGIGGALLDEYFAWAQQHGAKEILVGLSHENSPKVTAEGKHLLEERGFTLSGSIYKFKRY